MTMNLSNLPKPIAKKLKQSISRIKRIIFLRGLCAVLASILISVLFIMGINAVVMILSVWTSLLLSACGLIVIGLTYYFTLHRPLKKEITPAQIAAIIEERHPELEERISTVVELMSMSEDEVRGSQTLVDELTKMAEADVADVKVRKEFTARTVKPKFLAAIVSAAVLVALFLVFPKQSIRLVARAVIPFAQTDNIYAENLLVSPGDKVVMAGEPLEILLTVTGGFPGQAYVRRESSGREIEERMQSQAAEITVDGNDKVAESNRTFIHRFPSVDDSFRYRIVCGHALTKFYNIETVERPAATNLTLRCYYPEYTGKKVVERTGTIGDISAIPGTRFELEARLNRPDLEGVLEISPDRIEPENGSISLLDETEPEDSMNLGWNFEIIPEQDTTWALFLKDSNGFENTPVGGSIKSLADMAPTVTHISPEVTAMTLPPHGKIPVEYMLTDDFGISELSLCAGRGEEPVKRYKKLTDFEEIEPGVWKGRCLIDLSEITLDGVTQLRFQLKVADNLPAELKGPQRADGPMLVVTIDHEALSLESQSEEQQKDNLSKTLDDIMTRLRDSHECAVYVDDKLKAGKLLDDSDKEKLDSIRKETTISEKIVVQLIEGGRDSIFAPLMAEVEKLLSKTLTPVREKSEAAQLASEKDRKILVSQIRKLLDEALRDVGSLSDELGEFVAKLEALEKLDEMAAEQERLAQEAQELADAAEDAGKKEGEDGEKNDGEKSDETESDKQNGEKSDAEKEKDMLAALDAEEMKDWLEAQEKISEMMKEMMNEFPEAMSDALSKKEDEVRGILAEIEKLARQQQKLQELTAGLIKPATRTANAANIKKITSGIKGNISSERRTGIVEQTIAGACKKIAEEIGRIESGFSGFGESLSPVTTPMQSAARDLFSASSKAIEVKNILYKTPDPQNQSALVTEAQPGQKEVKRLLDSAAERIRGTLSKMDQLENQFDQQAMENKEEQMMSLEDMKNAVESMENAMEAFRKAMEEAQNQDGEQTGEGEKQDGEQQQGEKQDGEQQQGEKQNGEKQDGEQQQGEKQNGEKQQGEQQKGEQQQQQGQQQQDLKAAMEAAMEAAKQASQQMQNMVKKSADKMGVPMSKLPSAMKSEQESTKHENNDTLENINGVRLPDSLREKMSEKDWFKLGGQMKGGALGDSLEGVPPEYRELVRMYFNELSRQAE